MLWAGAASAAVYVDKGSIGGHCRDARTASQAASRSTPWCTLRKALRSAPAGSTVFVRQATYRRFDVSNFHRARYVWFAAYRDEAPLLKKIEISRSNHLGFRGLRIGRARAFNSSRLRFVHNDVTPSGLWAFFSHHLTFAHNKLHDVWDGIVVRKSSSVWIRDNEFVRIPLPIRAVGGDGIQASDMKRMVISHNLFHVIRPTPHADAIEFSENNEDVTIQKNRFRECRAVIVVPGRTAGATNTGWVVANNEFGSVRQFALELFNVPGIRIINNTAWDAGHGIRLHGATTGAVLLNNITTALEATASMIGREDYNLIGSGFRSGPHDLAEPPLFLDRATYDYRLARGSPGIDAGTSDGAPVTDLEGRPRFDAGFPNRGGGSKPYVDMGAYEFQN